MNVHNGSRNKDQTGRSSNLAKIDESLKDILAGNSSRARTNNPKTNGTSVHKTIRKQRQ